MGASAAAPTPMRTKRSPGDVTATLYYVYWYDRAYPHGEYSGYQDMLQDAIFGIPYKIGNNQIQASRFLNTVYGCTKYIVIITGNKKRHLVKEIHESPSIMGIYIIKPFAEKVEKWSYVYDKVRVYREYAPLLKDLVKILQPLAPIKEIFVSMKTAVEYLAHPNPQTMKQQTVSALADEKMQQEDQLVYKAVYSLTLNLIYTSYIEGKLSKEEFALKAYSDHVSKSKSYKINLFDAYMKMLKFGIRLDQYPLISAGISLPEVRKALQRPQINLTEVVDCFQFINPDKPLKLISADILAKLHSNLIQLIAIDVTKQNGTGWEGLYFPAMHLSDLDFCFKMFLQQILGVAAKEYTHKKHKEFLATLSQAAIASDVRISNFNDIVVRACPPKPNEDKKILSPREEKMAIDSCILNNILIFDINTSSYTNYLAHFAKYLTSANRKCYVYKLIQDFATDMETCLALRNKVVYVIIHEELEKLEFERLMNVFVYESITPIFILYLPNARSYELSKAMFRNKWIITTVYAETLEDVADYIKDSEININREMFYYQSVYSDFSQTLSSFRGDKEGSLSVDDDVEFDAGFEILTEINSSIFGQLVEELSLGTKLIGSLHFYMWQIYKMCGKDEVYWSTYAPLFGITPKTMNILDVNFGKNILRAYTLQTDPPFYKTLNDAFRGGDPSIIAKYRGFYVILHDLIKKNILQTYTGQVYRGTYFNPKVLETLKPGLRVFSTCFTSTSKSEYVAREFAKKAKRNVLLEIQLNPAAHSNVDIHKEQVSRYPEEQEVLILPFTAYQIVSFFYEENLTLIHLEEVIPDINITNLKGIDYYN